MTDDYLTHMGNHIDPQRSPKKPINIVFIIPYSTCKVIVMEKCKYG